MKRRTYLTFIVAVLLILSGAFFVFKGKKFEVVFTQENIDSALEAFFPATKEYLIVFRITYANPQVKLLEAENRIQVGLDATLNVRVNDEPKELGGGATINAGLRYESGTQAFFLDDVEFERFEIQGVPEQWLEKVTAVGSQAAAEFVKQQPVYRLEAKDAKTAAAKALLKDFKIRDQQIHVILGY